MNRDWKVEIQHIIKKGCTDSDIEDYVEEHPEINGKEIWDYVCDYVAPNQCKGCKYIQLRGSLPCTKCSRYYNKLEDYYKKR